MTNVARCNRCGRPIVWARTAKGKSIALDAKETRGGRWLIEDEGIARYLSQEEYEARGGTWLRRPHATKCKRPAVEQLGMGV